MEVNGAPERSSAKTGRGLGSIPISQRKSNGKDIFEE
jgi:hypothetical protein